MTTITTSRLPTSPLSFPPPSWSLSSPSSLVPLRSDIHDPGECIVDTNTPLDTHRPSYVKTWGKVCGLWGKKSKTSKTDVQRATVPEGVQRCLKLTLDSRAIRDIAHEVLAFAEGFLPIVPVPGLGGAAKLILDVWKGVDQMTVNKEDALCLVNRCADVLFSLVFDVYNAGGIVPEELKEPLEQLERFFHKVLNSVDQLNRKKFLEHFLKRDDSQRKIRNLHMELVDMLSLFGDRLQVRTYNKMVQMFKEVMEQQQDVLTRLERFDVHTQQQETQNHPLSLRHLPAVGVGTQVYNTLERSCGSHLSMSTLQSCSPHHLRLSQPVVAEEPRVVQGRTRSSTISTGDGASYAILPSIPQPTPGKTDECMNGLIDERPSRTGNTQQSSVTAESPPANLAIVNASASLVSSTIVARGLLASSSALESPLPLETLHSPHEEVYRRTLKNHGFHSSLTVPLWCPSPVELGAVGYLSKHNGSFVTLFNACNTEDALDPTIRLLPNINGYGRVNIVRKRIDLRTSVQRGADMFSRCMPLNRMSASRRRTISLSTGRETAVLYTDLAEYNYLDSSVPATKWFQAHVDKVIDVFSGIQKEGLMLIIGTLAAKDYALFASHSHPDGHVHFDKFKYPKKGQPWGQFVTDNSGREGPLYRDRAGARRDDEWKVSNEGGQWNSVLLAKLSFKPGGQVPTSL